jgi:6-phosphogluconolactonase (cycloisomerase 2 family)
VPLNRRTFIAGAAASLAGPGIAKAEAAAGRRIVYLGSFTSSGQPRGRGLDIGAFDGTSGRLTITGHVDGVPDASFLALSPDRRTLYATNERVPKGMVTALDVSGDPTRPKVLNHQPAGGSGPTHLSVHPGGRHLLTANYGDGTIAVHPLSADGRIEAPADSVRHQKGSRAHQVLVAPGGQWVVAVDLGADAIFVYGFDEAAGRLRQHQHLQVAAGTGPRHLVFHPGGRHAYILAERRSEITVAAWDAAAGRLTPGQVIGTLGKVALKPNYPAEVELSRDGRFLYASNRGHDSVAMFRIEPSGEQLVFGGTTACGGAWPRHFALDPSERWLCVANQKSNSVAWLPRDRASGKLGPAAGSATVNGVAMLLFG